MAVFVNVWLKGDLFTPLKNTFGIKLYVLLIFGEKEDVLYVYIFSKDFWNSIVNAEGATLMFTTNFWLLKVYIYVAFFFTFLAIFGKKKDVFFNVQILENHFWNLIIISRGVNFMFLIDLGL